MNITYRKSISLDTKCHDKESLISKRSKGHILRVENFENSKDFSLDLKLILPNGNDYYVDAESLKEMCDKVIKLGKV